MHTQGTTAIAPITVCPDPVVLSADQVTAALFTWSELPADTDAPRVSWLREDLAYIVATWGTARIEAAALRLPATVAETPWLADRLAWCRRAAAALTGARPVAVAL
jgi:hypothetical protein